MTERKSFPTKSPVPFDLGDDEEFFVMGAIPAEEFATLLDIQSGLTGEGIGIKEQYEGIKSIFAQTMLPESWERFSLRLSDRSRPVDFALLMQISNWLSGEIWSGKEAGEKPSSSTEPPETTSTSTDGSPPVALAPVESQPVEVSVVPDTSISSTTGEPEG